jgi:N6-adenosine-specific RNA methylase IME4
MSAIFGSIHPNDAWPFSNLVPRSYGLIAADPAWTFKLYSAKGGKKSPQAHYACMSLGDIKALPVADLAQDDCWLMLWTSAPMLDQAFDVISAWGFTYKSRTAWRKTTINGKQAMGPGYIVRTMHEDILIGTRGKPKRDKAFPSIFDGLRREHSRKPERFYELAERFAPDARRLDLFSRQSRVGWASFGNEASKFDGCADD